MNKQDLLTINKKDDINNNNNGNGQVQQINPIMFTIDPLTYQQILQSQQQLIQQSNNLGFQNGFPFIPHPAYIPASQLFNQDAQPIFQLYSEAFKNTLLNNPGAQFFFNNTFNTAIQMNQLKPTNGLQACELYQRQFAPQLFLKQGSNLENLQKKKKGLSNPKRNTIKNLGNQIISFICSKKSYEIIQKISDISLTEDEFICFKEYCHKFKNNMLKIADLRNVWIGLSQEPKFIKYHKLIRIMSRYYLNNEAVVKLLTSNKLKDRIIHLQIRRTLLEKLKDPQSFKALD